MIKEPLGKMLCEKAGVMIIKLSKSKSSFGVFIKHIVVLLYCSIVASRVWNVFHNNVTIEQLNRVYSLSFIDHSSIVMLSSAPTVFEKTAFASLINTSTSLYLAEKCPINNCLTFASFAILAASSAVEWNLFAASCFKSLPKDASWYNKVVP